MWPFEMYRQAMEKFDDAFSWFRGSYVRAVFRSPPGLVIMTGTKEMS